MDPGATYVIVGASLAGAKAAETLRAEGFVGRVLLLGAERQRPYERPPLSKDFLLGRAGEDSIYVHEPGYYEAHDIDLRPGTRVAAIHRSEHEIELADGSRLPYDKLLLTTGASPRPLPVSGAELDGVHYLRTAADSEQLRDTLREAGRVAVVGGGWIGLETAAAARGYGAHVTLVEPEPTPLYRVLGPELGTVFAELHREHGVDVRTGENAAGLEGERGRFRRLVTGGGSAIEADAAIVAVGVSPNVELAVGAGLDTADGVAVDSSLRTKDPDIYAAGDVASSYHPLLGQRVRVEHWANALAGGAAAAHSMLGREVTYDDVPYFFTDQYDLGMEYAGHVHPRGYDEVLYRGDAAAREFVAFWLTGGRVVAGMNVNVWDVNDAIQQLVRAGGPVDRDRLADPAVPLEELV